MTAQDWMEVPLDIRVKEKLKTFGQRAYSTFPTLEATYRLAGYCLTEDVPGDFVECGVAAGSQIAAMAYCLHRHGTHRMIHLYDSFEGIPEAGPRDDQQPGVGDKAPDASGRLVSSGITVHSREQVWDNLGEWGVRLGLTFHFHTGWFQETVMYKKPEKIALLRLDGDLYASTLVCLEHLYPLVVSGGIVIIDDYALKGCRDAVMDYFGDQLPKMTTIEGGQGPVWFQKA